MDDAFTDLEIDKFRECFKFFDRDGDGTIQSEDLGLAMRSVGALVTGKEVQVLLQKYDPDSKGKLDLKDFIACLKEVIDKQDDEACIRNAFSVFDKENNGLLPVDEMKHVFSRIGDSLSPEELNNFLGIIDTHGDGMVRMNDLVSLFKPQTAKDLYQKSVNVEKYKSTRPEYEFDMHH